MNEWINVKDRLPSENGKYLICFQKNIVISIFYNGSFYKSRFYGTNIHLGIRSMASISENKKYKVVTHWMPLAEYPKD